MYLALVSFAATCGLYLSIMPTLYLASTGSLWLGMMDDLSAMLKELLAVQIFFWLTLWAVKLSLLFMFKRLTEGIRFYTWWWWGVLGFTVVSYVLCVVSSFLSCSSMHAWFTAGLCFEERDARAKEISLWFSLAVDVASDFMSE
jgi:hypothetical protein